ncbi:MAG TPA: hypothetical protein VGQ37_23520 [Vicinamibacterales bacterium]|jgi:hypothetical protein|nr:hypothetical protein [Vicinamibacterales bacterium]
MTARLSAALVAGLLAASVSLSAQWPAHRTAAAPRAADGRVNMQGPVPRTPAGTPDLSGVWENIGWRELQQVSNDVSGTGGSPGTRPLVAAATGVLTSGPGLFFDIGAGVAGGLPLQPWAAALKKQRMAGNSMDNPDAHCLPLGNLQLHTHPQPRKMIQTADVLVMLYEGNAGVRQIFTDGRPLPANDPQPWWFGYSTGRWMGDVLVVETTGFRDGGWLDVNGSPLTDRGRTTERFRRTSYGFMEVEVTVDDPKAYTRPWTVTIKQRLMADDELIEFVCQENERSSSHFQ